MILDRGKYTYIIQIAVMQAALALRAGRRSGALSGAIRPVPSCADGPSRNRSGFPANLLAVRHPVMANGK
jgi:hypothetical protein